MIEHIFSDTGGAGVVELDVGHIPFGRHVVFDHDTRIVGIVVPDREAGLDAVKPERHRSRENRARTRLDGAPVHISS